MKKIIHVKSCLADVGVTCKSEDIVIKYKSHPDCGKAGSRWCCQVRYRGMKVTVVHAGSGVWTRISVRNIGDDLHQSQQARW